MAKRLKYKTRQTIRLKMRTVFVVCSILSGLVFGAMLFVFQLFENETTVAATDPMVISDIEVFQDTLPVLKGMPLQVVLGIKIQTKGKSQHLNLSGLELSARGTSKPASSYASNARLWSTGTDDYFIPSQQIGVTLPVIPQENFKFAGKQKLLEGDNYFWVTFDVNQVPGSSLNQLDAECISVQIGTLNHDPAVAAPPGSKRIQNNIPYYSTGNGDISSLNSWNSLRDGSGKRPANFNQSNATYHIQSGHILRNNLNASLPCIVIERNGVLLSASGIKSDRVEIHGGGTMVQDKTALNAANLACFVIKNGGNFIHRNKGLLPGKIKQFESHSNIVLNDYSSETFSEKIEWGNLIIDAETAANTEVLNCFESIKGNLEIRSTGKKTFLYTTAADTIHIGGDLLINGGMLIVSPEKNNMALCVNKEFVLKSGTFSDAFPGKSPKGSVEFYPGTKMQLKSGEFKMTGKQSFIHFHQKLVTWRQDTANLILPDITVMPGCTLKLEGAAIGMLAENRKFIVSASAMLDCGTSTLAGKGSFRLEPNGTLATAHIQGIHSGDYAGSIQTKTRFYSSSGNYEYCGTSSPQTTGIFTTSPHSNTVNQMTIKKTNPTGILILQQDLSITGRLVKERGSINKNSHKLETGEKNTTTATL